MSLPLLAPDPAHLGLLTSAQSLACPELSSLALDLTHTDLLLPLKVFACLGLLPLVYGLSCYGLSLPAQDLVAASSVPSPPKLREKDFYSRMGAKGGEPWKILRKHLRCKGGEVLRRSFFPFIPRGRGPSEKHAGFLEGAAWNFSQLAPFGPPRTWTPRESAQIGDTDFRACQKGKLSPSDKN